ncbi:MAG: CDP-diacylglycerol--glycerol-3-phosphate 3-phosphatidyltransferase [Nannocystaceae bacterium]
MTTRLQRLKRDVVNLPNMITIGRVFLIPPVLLLVDRADPFLCVLGMILFMLVSALDIVDGWLARRQQLVTVFGKFMDPLADKIMVMSLLIYLVADGRVPAWLVVVLLTREFYISGLRVVAASEGVVMAAGVGGKAKTGFQLIGICFLLVHYTYRMPGLSETINFHTVGLILLGISALLSVLSAVTYTLDFGAALASKSTE